MFLLVRRVTLISRRPIVRVPMFGVLRSYDAPEILVIVATTVLVVVGVVYFF
jgi:hypothetical protein